MSARRVERPTMSSVDRSPSTPSTRARGVLPWTLTAVLAVAVVVLAVLLATAGEEKVGSTGGSSARAACDLLDDLPDDPDDADSLGDLQLRLAAASSLAMLAAEKDDDYAGLDDALTRMRVTVSAEFSSDVPEFEEARDDAEGECADL